MCQTPVSTQLPATVRDTGTKKCTKREMVTSLLTFRAKDCCRKCPQAEIRARHVRTSLAHVGNGVRTSSGEPCGTMERQLLPCCIHPVLILYPS
eukprot:s2248_g19.t1